MGGLNVALHGAIASELKAAGVACEDAPPGLDATDTQKICTRGDAGGGVQLEISMGLRQSHRRAVLARAVRNALSS